SPALRSSTGPASSAGCTRRATRATSRRPRRSSRRCPHGEMSQRPQSGTPPSPCPAATPAALPPLRWRASPRRGDPSPAGRLAHPARHGTQLATINPSKEVDMMTIKAAAVQISPVLYSREGTVERVVRKIIELGRQGVQFATFPETVVPYYPYFSFVQR